MDGQSRLTSVSNWHQLCSKHFDVKCFKNINDYKRKLWPTAVPSLCTTQFEVVHQNCIPGITNIEENIVNNENSEENISLCSTQFEIVHQNCTPSIRNLNESITINNENPEEHNKNISLMDNSFNKR